MATISWQDKNGDSGILTYYPTEPMQLGSGAVAYLEMHPFCGPAFYLDPKGQVE